MLVREKTQNLAKTQKQEKVLGILEIHQGSPPELVSKLGRQTWPNKTLDCIPRSTCITGDFYRVVQEDWVLERRL